MDQKSLPKLDRELVEAEGQAAVRKFQRAEVDPAWSVEDCEVAPGAGAGLPGL